MEKHKIFDRNFYKQWPQLYYFFVVMFGPALLLGLNVGGFFKKYLPTGMVLNVGSGPRRLNREDVINFDMEQYPGVDIVGDISKIPMQNDAVDGIVCDNVLEHVRDIEVAISELHRVLKPGGYVYISTPFLYPYHSSPDDYRRWTMHGLKHLLCDFEYVESGVRSGPFSVINVWLVYFFASVLSFRNKSLYTLFLNMLNILFFPIKFLDIIFNLIPFSEDFASVLYIVVKKTDG